MFSKLCFCSARLVTLCERNGEHIRCGKTPDEVPEYVATLLVTFWKRANLLQCKVGPFCSFYSCVLYELKHLAFEGELLGGICCEQFRKYLRSSERKWFALSCCCPFGFFRSFLCLVPILSSSAKLWFLSNLVHAGSGNPFLVAKDGIWVVAPVCFRVQNVGIRSTPHVGLY